MENEDDTPKNAVCQPVNSLFGSCFAPPGLKSLRIPPQPGAYAARLINFWPFGPD
jgi:hypothetical protein